MVEPKYILEGIFTQFDRVNRNNGRIYPELGSYLKYLRNRLRKSKIKNIYV